MALRRGLASPELRIGESCATVLELYLYTRESVLVLMVPVFRAPIVLVQALLIIAVDCRFVIFGTVFDDIP